MRSPWSGDTVQTPTEAPQFEGTLAAGAVSHRLAFTVQQLRGVRGGWQSQTASDQREVKMEGQSPSVNQSSPVLYSSQWCKKYLNIKEEAAVTRF